MPAKISLEEEKNTLSINGGQVFSRDGKTSHAFIYNDQANITETVIILHGNAGHALHRTYYVDALKKFHLRVILLEYPSYGSRDGEQSETIFVQDAIETIKTVQKRFPGQIYLWGESMGCGVAASVIQKVGDDISGAALLTPWSTLPEMAQTKYWFLPAKLICRDSYDNLNNLTTFQKPIVFIIAQQDEIIPNKLSYRLYQSYKGPKNLIEFPHAGHNNWPSDAHEKWWGQVVQFWRQQNKKSLF